MRGLQWASVCYIRRGGNRVAHVLAQYVRNTYEDVYWMKDSPPPAIDTLYRDISLL